MRGEPSSMEILPLAEAQIRFFDTFGFLALRGAFADRIQTVIADFEALWESRGGGHGGRPHDGTARSCIAPFIDQSEALSALVDDPRIRGIAISLLGADYNYMGSDGNYYVGDTPWHSDGWHRQVRHIKIAFYLDTLDATNGCLRVIPGSHRIGDRWAEDLQRDLRASGDHWGLSGSEIPAIALDVVPGDLLIFNHNTKHAAFGGGQRRRMFTMNLCERYPEELLPELREYLSGAARFWVERAYGPAMIATAGPDRLPHLEQCLANDGHLAELSRQAREKMSEPSRG